MTCLKHTGNYRSHRSTLQSREHRPFSTSRRSNLSKDETICFPWNISSTRSFPSGFFFGDAPTRRSGFPLIAGGLLSSLKSPRTEANEIAAGQRDHVLHKLIERARHGDQQERLWLLHRVSFKADGTSRYSTPTHASSPLNYRDLAKTRR